MKTKLTVLLITLFFGISARIAAQHIITVAGNGSPGSCVDGVLAIATSVSPIGIALDDTGNIYFTDMDAHLNKIDLAGVLHVIAGNGAFVDSGDGGLAINAAIDLSTPAIDKNGDIYLAEFNEYIIRKIDARTGIIQRVAGIGICGFSGDGGPATAASLGYIGGFSMDNSRHILYVSDTSRIRKIDAGGTITTIAGGGSMGFTGDGGPASAALLNYPAGLSIDQLGNIYDVELKHVRKIDTNGIIKTIGGTGIGYYSGDGGQATDAEINTWGPSTVDSFGNVFFLADTQRVRKINPAGIITTVAGNGYQIAIEGGGFTDYYGGYNGDGITATAAELNNPAAVAVDKFGNLFIADFGNYRIREVCNCTVNSVPTTSESKIITLTPNPNSGSFTIQLPSSVPVANITITNALGKVVERRNVATPNGIEETFHLEVPAGNYLLRVDAGATTYREKITVW